MPLGATDSLIRRLVDPAEVADLLKRGRELVAAGNIPAARVLLKRAAEAGDASAALELGGTYDPIVFKELRGNLPSSKGKPAPSIKQVTDKARDPGPNMATAPDIPMARLWYQTAKDLGSVEASIRLERLSGADQ
jgi:TPR repeat protein